MWRCLKTALLLILSIWTLNTCAVCVSKPGAIKVTTWDGSKVPVCDTHMCDESLNLLSVVSPIKPTATRFGSKLKNYVADLDQIGGWMSPWHITLVAALTQKQWDLGITGSVGEIGVYKGKFLINIAGHALPEEPVLACDLFANQTNPEIKYDAAKAPVEAALDKYLEYTAHTTILDMNSMDLSTSIIASHNLPAFRMFSIDGGHTLEITLHDLNLASCAVAPGGIVILDDINNSHWLGVATAAQLFSTLQDNLVPFLQIANKLYFTTQSHHALYLDFVQTSMPELKCGNLVTSMHPSRVSWGQWRVCHGDMTTASQ